MLYAISTTGELIRPSLQEDHATDPYSGQIARGVYTEGQRHWRLQEGNYDGWAFPDGVWNLEWKLKFPKTLVEISVQGNTEKHVADVRTNTGLVLNFQARSLDEKQLKQREVFFGQMLWIFKADGWDLELMQNPTRYKTTEGRDKKLPTSDAYGWIKFKSRHSKSVYKACKMPVFLDFGDDSLYWLNWQSKSNLDITYHPHQGLLKSYSKEQFIKKYSQL